MSYCINPKCQQRQNSDDVENCQSCGTPLLINERYWLVRPLRDLEIPQHNEIFEVDDCGDRKVLKVLNNSNPDLVKQFKREARSLQVLKHPGIPQVEIDGYFTITPKNGNQKLHCLVMEYIDGENLEQWLEKHRRLSQSLAIKWLRQLIEILEYVHKNRFFHRDIKPSNIILKPDNQLVLIDFGSIRGTTKTHLEKIRERKPGTRIISAGYSPPEQINGQALPQSDFYALGRTFVHLLTGKPPFNFPQDLKTGKLIWRNQAPQVSAPLADFIDELMSLFPGDRPKNTQEILQHLTANSMFLEHILRLFGSRKSRFKTIVTMISLLTLGVFILNIERWSSPLRAEFYFESGRKERKNGDLNKAREYFEQAIALDPKKAIFYINLASVCQSQQNFKCASDNFQHSLNLKPDKQTVGIINKELREIAQYYHKIGQEKLQNDDLNEARKYFEQAIALNPKKAIFYNDLGLTCKSQNDFKCASDNFDKALNFNSDKETVAIIKYNLGEVYEDSRDFDNAKQHYQLARTNKQYDIAFHATNNLARLLIMKEKDYESAVNILTEALYLARDDSVKLTLYKNRGWVYFQLGQYKQAEEDLKEAIALEEKDNPSAAPHCLMAMVLQQSNKSGALDEWKQCRNGNSLELPEVETWQLQADAYIRQNSNNKGKKQ